MKWNPDYLLRIIAEEYVLVPIAGEAAKSSQIIAINQTVGEICEMILQGKGFEEIIEAMMEEYDAERQILEEDLSATLSHLKALNALLP